MYRGGGGHLSRADAEADDSDEDDEQVGSVQQQQHAVAGRATANTLLGYSVMGPQGSRNSTSAPSGGAISYTQQPHQLNQSSQPVVGGRNDQSAAYAAEFLRQSLVQQQQQQQQQQRDQLAPGQQTRPSPGNPFIQQQPPHSDAAAAASVLAVLAQQAMRDGGGGSQQGQQQTGQHQNPTAQAAMGVGNNPANLPMGMPGFPFAMGYPQYPTLQQQQQLQALLTLAQLASNPAALQQLGATLQLASTQQNLNLALAGLFQAPSQNQQQQQIAFNPLALLQLQQQQQQQQPSANLQPPTQQNVAQYPGLFQPQHNLPAHAFGTPNVVSNGSGSVSAPVAAAATRGAAATPDDAVAARKPAKRRRYSHECFPSKLHRLICNAEKDGKDDVVRFTENGTRFQIVNTAAFERELPQYFRHGNIRSFGRLLRMYDFRRICGTWMEGTFEHPKFRQDTPELCREMERVETKYGSLY